MTADELADWFDWYADWAADRSSLYERLSRGAAGDEDLLAIAAEARAGQPPPQLLLGAVQDLLLRAGDHPLARFYPTCTDDPRDPTTTDPIPAFRSFCLANEARLRRLVGTRRVQTNAVGRSAVLFPAFGHVARRTNRRPLALIEVGTSAGLNLFWDGYRYEYHPHGVHGDPDSSVRIETAVRGDGNPPLPEPPSVGSRVGVDIHPLDVTDPADRRWLRALVIPDQRERHERLAAAIEQAREDPPRLVEGDALDVLPGLLADAPDGQARCVYSTHTLYQLKDEAVDRLRAMLVEHSADRPIHWLATDRSDGEDGLHYRHVSIDDGERERSRLAAYDSYGAWIRWLGGDG